MEKQKEFGKNKTDKAKVLYITSVGHSGSTLLDLICGTLPNVFSAGEVQFLSWQLLQGANPSDPQTYCSCGKSFNNCDLWKKIINNISEKKKIDIFKNPQKYSYSINRNIKRYEDKRILKIINLIFQLSITYSVFSFLKYLIYLYFLPSIKRNWDFFDQISKTTGVKYIVDSSKNINRFLLLQMYNPKRIKLIVLKRDIKGVVSSSHNGLNQNLIKKRAHSWLKFYNKKLKLIYKTTHSDNILHVNYEDICKETNATREKIALFLKIKKPVDEIKAISPYKYHTIQGNPLRLKKEDLDIKYDERWKKRLSTRQIEWLTKLTENYSPNKV